MDAPLGFALRVGGLFVCSDADEKAVADLAARINRRVEQREARLVAALRRAYDHLDCSYRCASNSAGISAVECDCGADEAITIAAEALRGCGDYVPRAELEAERERTRGAWALLADELNTGGPASERAAECMRALGLKTEPDKKSSAALGDLVRLVGAIVESSRR